jgi:uncharacterized protein YbjT (DUF2867 family)
VTVSTSDQETVLVIGATGRHGGTGARVVQRLQAAGRAVRALVRSDDDRAQRLRQSGVHTLLGDLHDRRTLLPALDGAESVYVAYPVAAGVATALANVASVIHELDSSPHVVINSHGTVDHDSPSGISREFALGEELMLELGVNEFSTDVKCCDDSGGRFMLVAERAMPWSAWRLLSWHARSARCVVGVCGG